ncbi:hypothetical protein Hanom_Chr08g00748491 [Helianthus anomalus]
MALALKSFYNYLCTLEKTSQNTTFHFVIDALSSSKYKTLLTCNAPIYLDTLRNFWKHAQIEVEDKKPWAIPSNIGGILITVTPQTISEVFEINDLTGKKSFPKKEYQTDLIERGYEEEMKKKILCKKGVFHLP